MSTEARTTDYQILIAVSDTNWRDMLPLISASGANAAIRQWVALQGDDFAGGTLRAVPCRSLNTTTVKVETQKKLTLA